MRERSLILLFVACTGLALSCGACNDPAAARAESIRRERIEDLAQLYAEREQDSPRRMQQTLDYATQSERWHARHRRNNAELLEKRWRFEVERWQNQSRYEQAIREALDGDQRSAEWAIRKMFY